MKTPPTALALVLLGALGLSAAALYNGYPMVTPDSGGYIDNAFTFFVCDHQPIAYSLFLRATSLGKSLWATVAAQALLASALVFLVVRAVAPALSAGRYIFLLAALTLFTSAPWYVGQIMADALTGTTFLAAFLLWSLPAAQRTQLGFAAAAVFLAALCHFSHLLYVLALGVLTVRTTGGKRLLALGLAVAVAIPTLNAALGRGFFLEKSSNDFLMGRLYETGILDRVLRRHCPDGRLPFCDEPAPVRGTINYFLWDKNSPHRRVDREWRRERYPRALWLALRDYPGAVVGQTAWAMAAQLVRFASGDAAGPLGPENGIYWSIRHLFPTEFAAYVGSRQERGLLDYRTLNWLQFAFLLVSVVYLGWASRKEKSNGGRFPRFALLSVLLNAVICGGLTGGFYRYGARAIWILPLAMLTSWLSCSSTSWSEKRLRAFPGLSRASALRPTRPAR